MLSQWGKHRASGTPRVHQPLTQHSWWLDIVATSPGTRYSSQLSGRRKCCPNGPQHPQTEKEKLLGAQQLYHIPPKKRPSLEICSRGQLPGTQPGTTHPLRTRNPRGGFQPLCTGRKGSALRLPFLRARHLPLPHLLRAPSSPSGGPAERREGAHLPAAGRRHFRAALAPRRPGRGRAGQPRGGGGCGAVRLGALREASGPQRLRESAALPLWDLLQEISWALFCYNPGKKWALFLTTFLFALNADPTYIYACHQENICELTTNTHRMCYPFATYKSPSCLRKCIPYPLPCPLLLKCIWLSWIVT